MGTLHWLLLLLLRVLGVLWAMRPKEQEQGGVGSIYMLVEIFDRVGR